MKAWEDRKGWGGGGGGGGSYQFMGQLDLKHALRTHTRSIYSKGKLVNLNSNMNCYKSMEQFALGIVNKMTTLSFFCVYLYNKQFLAWVI